MAKGKPVRRQDVVRMTLIILLVLIVSFLHYFTGTEHSHHHGIYRRLYYLPIILSGFWYGMRGGVVSGLVISAIYLPHVLLQWENHPAVRLEQLLEILLYNVIGMLTGFLSSQINYQRLRAEKNMQQLAESYTKLKEQADMIVEIEDQLRQADRLTALGELSAGLAHEIRNPLGAIRGTAEILNDSLPEHLRHGEFSQLMISEVDRLNQVVENFLKFARPSTNQQTEFKPEEVLSEVLQLTQHQAVKNRIQVHWEKTALPQAVGDSVQFKQVFLNLVLNALQAIDHDGDLWIESSFSEHEITLKFRDSGPGIPSDCLDKVFNPFYTTKAAGTGLGLAITYRIVQSHNGKICARIPPQGGAEFILSLKRSVLKSTAG